MVRTTRIRSAIALLAVLLVGTGLATLGGPARAAATFDLERLAGGDRFATAVEVSKATFPGGATTAVIVRHNSFPDALAGATLAGALESGSPILLSTPAEVPAATMAELDRLGTETVVLLGGTGALSSGVESQLDAAGYQTIRVAGANRYATMRAIAAELADDNAVWVGPRGRTAALATGQNFPDALAFGGGAYAVGIPMVLTTTASLHPDADAALDELNIDHVVILGGEAAVSAATAAAVAAKGITTERLSGDTRYATAAKAADWVVANLGFDASHVDIATGSAFPDALTGNAHSGSRTAPTLLTLPNSVPTATGQWLQTHEAELIDGHIFGGLGAVSAETEAALEAAGGAGDVAAADYGVSPSSPVTNSVSTESGADADRGARTFTVTGLTDGQTYRIALLPRDEVTVASDGSATFGDDEGTAGQADNIGTSDTGAARIEKVNGATITPATHVANAPASGGQLTFTLDSTATDGTVPVVFHDDDADGQLDLDGADQPTEPYGVGGETRWAPEEAAAGAIGTDTAVDEVSKTDDYIVAGDRTYFYDSGDTFQIASTPTSGDEASTCSAVEPAQFESVLSPGDELDQSSDYQPDPANDSTFCLENLSPTAPTGVTATASSGSQVDVVWDAVTGADSYKVYRSTDTDSTEGNAAASCQPATDAAYALAGTTTGSTTSFSDTGRAASTTYCYRVTAVDAGEESARSAPDDATTLASGEAAPQSTSAAVTDDAGTTGTADASDGWRIVFSEPVEVADDDTISVSDGTDSATIQLDQSPDLDGNEATWQLNSGPVTIGGTTYEAGRVLDLTLADTPGTSLQYDLTITGQSGITDLAASPNPWTPADDPDHVIDDDSAPPPTSTQPPAFASSVNAVRYASGPANDRIDLNYTEPVEPQGGTYAASQFVYDPDCNSSTNPNTAAVSVTTVDTDTLRASFPAATLPATNQSNDCIRYTDDNPSAIDSGDVVDTDSTPKAQTSGDDVALGAAAAAPQMQSSSDPKASVGSANDQVDVSYTRSVAGHGGSFAASQFAYDADCNAGTANVVAAAVTAVDGDTLRVELPARTLPTVDDADDCIRYTDDNGTSTESGDVVDAATGAQAAPSDDVGLGAADATPPSMISAVPSAVSILAIEITYTEAVQPEGSYSATRFMYDSDCSPSTTGDQVVGLNVAQVDADTLRVTFAGPLPTGPNPCVGYDDPTYNPNQADAGDVTDLFGFPQVDLDIVGLEPSA